MLKRFRTFQREGLETLVSQSQVVETSYGSVEYAVRGDGQPFLLFHGSFGGYDQALWSTYFLKNTGAKFIAPSRFGYLRTPLPADGSPEAQARAFAALLDILAIKKVCLIGLSAGGMSALQFALHFPERCRGLVMISAVSLRPVKTPPIRFIVEHVFTNEFLGWVLATYWPHLVAGSTGDDYSLVAGNPELREAFLYLAWPPHASQRRVGMLNDLAQAETLPNYPFEKITVPTLVIHGTADPFVPFDSAKQLAAKVARAKLVAFQKGGHLSFLTQQVQTKDAILDFIDIYSKGQSHI